MIDLYSLDANSITTPSFDNKIMSADIAIGSLVGRIVIARNTEYVGADINEVVLEFVQLL